MTMGDKIKHAAEKVAGKSKATAGKVTGNEDLEAEGRAQALGADAKKASDEVADAAKSAVGE